jgi:hypothetical protein
MRRSTVAPFVRGVSPIAALAALLHCSSSPTPDGVACTSVSPNAPTTASEDTCYPDNDGKNNDVDTVAIAVDDTGFSATGADAGAKNIISTQNDSQVTLTLTNNGTKPHGFEVGCVSVCSSYATLPVGCSPMACFPSGATIAPIAPGTSATVTFETPTPDGLLFPFTSNDPDDSAVPGLNDGQWNLM